jgi:hypothetical protein
MILTTQPEAELPRTYLKITFVLKLHHLRHPGESRDPDFLENFANAGSRLSPG